MKKEDKEKALLFLKEYEGLCLKHRLQLNGCGCCGSPYLDELEGDNIELSWKTYEDYSSYEQSYVEIRFINKE